MTIEVVPHTLAPSGHWTQEDSDFTGEMRRRPDNHAEMIALCKYSNKERVLLFVQNAFPCDDCHNTFISKTKILPKPLSKVTSKTRTMIVESKSLKIIISIQDDKGTYRPSFCTSVPGGVKPPCLLIYPGDGGADFLYIEGRDISKIPKYMFSDCAKGITIAELPQYTW